MTCEILKNIRVLDLGSFVAGPAATLYLSYFGAEVIKIEHPRRPDGARLFSAAPNQISPNPRTAASQVFSQNNLNKKSVAIDYSTKEGKGLIDELIKLSDVVCENMSVGTLEKYGLDYDSVRKIKPDIIYLASSSCGEGGPDEKYIGYASTFASKVGLGALTGYAGSPPSTFVGSIDVRSATNAALAMLAALYYRKITGEGQKVEISSQEAIASQLGDVYLDYILNEHNQGRMANAREGFAPQGVFKTNRNDSWIALSVESDKQWKSLCLAMGNLRLLDEQCFSTQELRFKNRELLDETIEGWTTNISLSTLIQLLQNHEIPCGPVYDAKGVYEDPQRIEQESYYMIDSRDLGKECVQRPSWRFEKTPIEVPREAPFWGEHTIQVLKDLLGRDDGEIQYLAERRAIRRVFDD